MDREELWVEVNENTRTNNSFNARIAVAMAKSFGYYHYLISSKLRLVMNDTGVNGQISAVHKSVIFFGVLVEGLIL